MKPRITAASTVRATAAGHVFTIGEPSRFPANSSPQLRELWASIAGIELPPEVLNTQDSTIESATTSSK